MMISIHWFSTEPNIIIPPQPPAHHRSPPLRQATILRPIHEMVLPGRVNACSVGVLVSALRPLGCKLLNLTRLMVMKQKRKQNVH